MPIRKVAGGWKIGSGKATYATRASAERAYKAYRAKKRAKKGR